MARRLDESTTLDPALAKPGQSADGGVVLVLYHSGGVKARELNDGEELIVGRSSAADVAMDFKSLSRRHARFVRRRDTIEVFDLESRNGSFLDGKRIAEAPLRPGDVLMLGDPCSGLAVLIERLSQSARRRHRVLSDDDFRARLAAAIASTRGGRQHVALAILRSCAPRPRTDFRHWSTDVLEQIDAYHEAGAYDPQSLLLMIVGDRAEHVYALAAKLDRCCAEHRLAAGVACVPGAAATAEELIHSARRACLSAAPGKTVIFTQSGATSAQADDESVVFDSPAMSELYQVVQRVAPTDVTVLILGETGTGKEVIASTLHRLSARSAAPFRTVNCAAIAPALLESTLFGHEKGAFTGAVQLTKGVFEQADGGTIFLDEIGELTPALQAALLRVLENKRIVRVGGQSELQLDVRVLAATHRDLERMVDQEQFRRDLWFRLSAIELRVPPLRERTGEILPLADQFLRHSRARFGSSLRSIDARAADRLLAYGWPGNVRELRNVIERAALLGKGTALVVDDLPQRLRTDVTPAPASGLVIAEDRDYQHMIRDYEIRLITEGLRIADGSQTRAARLLKLPLRTLVYKIRQYAVKYDK